MPHDTLSGLIDIKTLGDYGWWLRCISLDNARVTQNHTNAQEWQESFSGKTKTLAA
jgi:hypothetical protein